MSAATERLLRRIDCCHTRFEETGDEVWLTAAMDADRLYLRLRERDAS